MNWYCFLNRIAIMLGLTESISGHHFDAKHRDGRTCVRCGQRLYREQP